MNRAWVVSIAPLSVLTTSAMGADEAIELIAQERAVSTFLTNSICGGKAFEIAEAPGFGVFEATLTKSVTCKLGATGTTTAHVSFIGESMILGHSTASFEHESKVPSLGIADSTSKLEATFGVERAIEYDVVGHLGAALDGGDFAFVVSSLALERVEDDATVFAFNVTHEDDPIDFDLAGELQPGTYVLVATTTAFLDDGDATLAGGLGSFDFELFLTGGCAADFNGDGTLDILDFIAFQGAFVAGDPSADCDANGRLNVLDFVCFQSLFQAGCR